MVIKGKRVGIGNRGLLMEVIGIVIGMMGLIGIMKISSVEGVGSTLIGMVGIGRMLLTMVWGDQVMEIAVVIPGIIEVDTIDHLVGIGIGGHVMYARNQVT